MDFLSWVFLRLFWTIGPWALLGIQVVVWALISVGLAFALWKLLPKGRIGNLSSAIIFVIVLTLPFSLKEFSSVLQSYVAQREATLSEKCREATDAAVLANVNPIRVEGFLITTNYEKLLNERYKRNLIPFGSSVALANHPVHPILDVFPEETFAAKAYALLTQKGFSYLEIELIPNGYKGEYSNAGHLDSRSWSGTRYRLYYLAPGDHPRCVNERGEGEISGLSVRAEDLEELAKKKLLEKPVCLALDITKTSVSKVRINGDEHDAQFDFDVNWRWLKIPMWTSVHADRVQITGSNGEQFTYLGFNYPDEVNPKYRCTSSGVAGAIVGIVLVANGERSFYQDKNWYQGSAVQRFYEPGKAAIVGNTTSVR